MSKKEIWYETSDKQIIEPINRPSTGAITPEYGFGAIVYSNTYLQKGIIKCTHPITQIGISTFYNKSTLVKLFMANSVKAIYDSAFQNCTSLIEIVIPESVTQIGDFAFDGCSSLTSITIPDGVTQIRNAAFGNCSRLTNINIPEGVTEIGANAFHDCSSLAEIVIPGSVTKIGERAFDGCSSLTEIYIKSNTPPIIYYTIFEWGIIDNIYVPSDSVEAYKNSDTWGSYGHNRIKGYDF